MSETCSALPTPVAIYLGALGGFVFLGLVIASVNGWFARFGAVGRAKRKRTQEVDARVAIYIEAGLDEYDARCRARAEMAEEAKAALA